MPVKGFRGERFRIDCPCGNVLFVVKSKKDIAKYCSKVCFNKYHPSPVKGTVRSNSYNAIHCWVRKYKQKPNGCQFCGQTEGRLEWANKSHEYKRDLDDWMYLCKKCHKKYDLDEGGHLRSDTRRFKDVVDRFPHRRKRLYCKELIIEIFMSTETQRAISERLGLYVSLVSRIRKRTLYYNFTKDLIPPKVQPEYIKITNETASEIKSSNLSGRVLAKMYNVSEGTVSAIKNGKRW